MRASLISATDYESDFHAWTQEQAALLRARRGDAIDWDHLAEEIESLGGRDRRELLSRLSIIVLHLLKWQFQPTRRGSSWRKSIRTQRREINILFKQSPSLRRHVPDLMEDAFNYALEDAVEQTRLEAEVLPTTCPYTSDQVLDPTFLPEAAAGAQP